MPEANPLNPQKVTMCCACGVTTMICFTPVPAQAYRCHCCDTPPTHRVLRVHRPDGPRHWLWKGDDAGYGARHDYMLRNYPKTGQCETCGKSGKTHWANRDHRYRRVLEDWAELCPGCHKTHDLELARRTAVDSAVASTTA